MFKLERYAAQRVFLPFFFFFFCLSHTRMQHLGYGGAPPL